ncbi:M56 family metallopeptidase [Dactylosporangium sp. NPDC000244]|uniref:M56 family metallopeptidase n=1 Tax=Dactylosporangium sp. NPDC000244 TaxID=3154365 RepID=UPI00331A46B0
MFDHFVWSVLAVPPLLVIAVRLLADRLAPGAAARAVAWSAAAAAIGSTVNLALFAAHAAAEVPFVGRALGWSTRIVARDTASEPWVPWLSIGLLAAAAGSVSYRWMRQRRLLRLLPSGPAEPVVMVPDATAGAFAVPGRPGHVVVTTGMRDLLTDRQFEALLAHERAHLAERHHRLVRMTELAVAAHPALWWVGRHVDYLVERAADERAAAALGDRRTVAHAIGTAALAGTAPHPAGLHAASVGGVVPRRVSHLLRPHPAVLPRVLAVIPVLVGLSSLVWTGEAALDLIQLFAAAAR